MVTLEPMVGMNSARLTARPCRLMIAALLGVGFLAVFAASALAAASLARIEAHYAEEARV